MGKVILLALIVLAVLWYLNKRKGCCGGKPEEKP